MKFEKSAHSELELFYFNISQSKGEKAYDMGNSDDYSNSLREIAERLDSSGKIFACDGQLYTQNELDAPENRHLGREGEDILEATVTTFDYYRKDNESAEPDLTLSLEEFIAYGRPFTITRERTDTYTC